MFLTHSERSRIVMGAGMIAAAGIGLVAGMAAPLPQGQPARLYELAVYTVPGETHIADYNLTFSDCVGRWNEYPASVGLECNPIGER